MMRRVANSITGLVSNQIALNRCIPYDAMAATHAIDSIHRTSHESPGNLLFLLHSRIRIHQVLSSSTHNILKRERFYNSLAKIFRNRYE